MCDLQFVKLSNDQNPSGLIGGGFRGVMIDGFPYVIVFSTDGGGLAVFGLRHAASDRSSWFERTMDRGGG